MTALRRLLAACARLARTFEQRRGPAQAIAGALALALGFWGWQIKAPPDDFAGWFNNVFRTIQLVTLQFPTNLESGIPWQLHVARFAVPLVAALATFHVLVGAITRPVRLALMPHARGHIIVCGAEQLTAQALDALALRGRQIVIVAATVDPARRDALEGLGMTVVEAAPREPATFRGLNLRHAAAVLLTAEDDLTNLDLALLAMAEAKLRPADAPPLALALLIGRDDLARELDAALDATARAANVRYHRLCPDRDGLRLALADTAPVFRKPDHAVRSHILVVGLEGAWPQVLMQLLIAAQDHPDAAPLLTLVLTETEREAFNAFAAGRPDLPFVAQCVVVPRDAGLLLPDEAALSGWRTGQPAPDLVVVLTNDADAVATVLALRRPGNPFGLTDQPILARRATEDRLFPALQGVGPRVLAFGGLIRAETIERVLDWRGDDLAIALHAHYLDVAKTLGAGSPEALKSWDALAENLRDANRAAADHAAILFAAVGLKPGAPLPETLVEPLAKIEHRRWMADRIDRGWSSGALRDNDRRIHPSIAPFEALSPADQEKDRNAVRVLAALLASQARGATKA